MPDVEWIKLLTTLPDDEKIIESMPDRDAILVIWIKLLVQAGKCNADGYIYLSETAPYTDEQLATISNRPLNTIRLAMGTFKQLEMINIEEDGKIFLINFAKIQNVDALKKIRETTRLRVEKHRAKVALQTCNENVTEAVTLRNAAEGEGRGEDLSNQPSPKTQNSERDSEGEGDQKDPLPSPGDKYILEIYNTLVDSYQFCFLSLKDKDNGKGPSGKDLAQIRDLATELAIAKCQPALILDGFKEAASAAKPYVSYVRAVLLDWLRVER